MKKRLLLGMLLFAGLTASAQEGLPDGTIAPDFTVTDINGTSHTLSTYLAQGKTVIMDISATWCGPCWSFHNSHTLRDIYETYGMGPNGSGEVVVLFVEGDPTTSLESLYGTNIPSDTRQTQGNWVEGVPYPIINSSEIATLYQLPYYPIVYMICPETGKTKRIDSRQGGGIIADVENACKQIVGLPNKGRVTSQDKKYCDAEGMIQGTFTNYGSDVTSVTASLKKDGTLVESKTFDVTVNGLASTALKFTSGEIVANADYQIELTQINGQTPSNFNTSYLTSETFNVTPSNTNLVSNRNVKVTVYTDNYPGEIIWALINSDGNLTHVQYYQPGPAQDGAGGPDANTTKIHNLELPEDCYSIVLADQYGDGWNIGNTQHGFKLESGNDVIFEHDGDFTVEVYEEAKFKSNGVLSTKAVEAITSSAIYPNPSNGILNLSVKETVDVSIIDITGKTVYTAKGINNGGTINVSTLQKGMYIAKIKGTTTEINEKIIIN